MNIRIQERFGLQNGTKREPTWHPNGSQNGSKIDPKYDDFFDRFLSGLGGYYPGTGCQRPSGPEPWSG